jgi:hypothetical protein
MRVLVQGSKILPAPMRYIKEKNTASSSSAPTRGRYEVWKTIKSTAQMTVLYGEARSTTLHNSFTLTAIVYGRWCERGARVERHSASSERKLLLCLFTDLPETTVRLYIHEGVAQREEGDYQNANDEEGEYTDRLENWRLVELSRA